MARPRPRPGATVLRLLAAAAVAAAVGGCTAVAAPLPPTASRPPLTASPTPTSAPPVAMAGASTTSATRPAAGPTSRRRATPAVTLKTFAGSWSGHTRSLTVSASGVAHETVSDGCCTPVVDMTFRLSNPRGTGAAHATATATVTAVALFAADLGPAPAVGRTGTVTLVDGVLTISFDGATFCDGAAAARSECGA